MPTISKRPLLEFVQSVLQSAGAPEDSARCVSELLVQGDCAGHPSHGLMRLKQYLEEIESKRLDPRARPQISKQTPVTTLVDGNRGFGQVTASYALEIGLQMVEQQGMAAVAMHRTFHFGRLGDYPERAARQGWIGLAWANGLRSPPCVAPFGGRKAAMGTNPFAAAIPRPDGNAPIVVDFATSMWAEGKVRVARNRGKQVPPAMILDADGQESTNPHDFYDGGCLLPVGGHKGYCLSLVCDLLAGMLTGSGSPCMPDYEGSNSVLFILLNPECFRSHEDFLRDVQQYGEVVASTPTVDGVEKVLLPGEPENQHREQHEKTVDLDEPTWKQLLEIAGDFSLQTPSLL